MPWSGPSTPAQRREARTALGPRFDEHARTVAGMLVDRPGLLDGEPDPDAALADLVALAAYLAAEPGDPLTGSPAVLACVVSGLLRLPTHFGPVASVWTPPMPSGPDRRALAGLLRTRPGPVPGGAEFVSLTGRRTRPLSPVDEVVFLPGTEFEPVPGRATVVFHEVAAGPAVRFPEGR